MHNNEGFPLKFIRIKCRYINFPAGQDYSYGGYKERFHLKLLYVKRGYMKVSYYVKHTVMLNNEGFSLAHTLQM